MSRWKREGAGTAHVQVLPPRQASRPYLQFTIPQAAVLRSFEPAPSPITVQAVAPPSCFAIACAYSLYSTKRVCYAVMHGHTQHVHPSARETQTTRAAEANKGVRGSCQWAATTSRVGLLDRAARHWMRSWDTCSHLVYGYAVFHVASQRR